MGFPRITYGDGTSLPRTTVDHLVEVSRAHRVPHVWERGDLLLLDNHTVLHGRLPHRGPRQVVVALV